MLRVFVYGTLQPGQVNYAPYCGDRVLQAEAAQVQGLLFDLPLGYPAMTAGQGWVQGYLLSFPEDKILSSLDELEDYHPDRPSLENEYERCWVEVFDLELRSLGDAWVYRMPPEKVVHLGGKWLPQGYWPT